MIFNFCIWNINTMYMCVYLYTGLFSMTDIKSRGWSLNKFRTRFRKLGIFAKDFRIYRKISRFQKTFYGSMLNVGNWVNYSELCTYLLVYCHTIIPIPSKLYPVTTMLLYSIVNISHVRLDNCCMCCVGQVSVMNKKHSGHKIFPV